MKRFHFPLRPVAIVRANKELRAREALADALRAASAAEERLALSRLRVKEIEGVIFEGRKNRFKPADEAVFFQAYRRECAAVMESERQVIAAYAEVAKRRQACVDANREVKVVARLEEKARAAYAVESLRVEQQQIDEIAGFRAYKTRQTQ